MKSQSNKLARRLLIAAAAALAAIAMAGCGSAAPLAAQTVTAAAAPAVTVVSTVERTPAPVTTTLDPVTVTVRTTVPKTLPAVTHKVVVTTIKTAAPVTVTAQPPGPKTSFGPGMQLVGTDIQPGTYRSAGGSMCYWERMSGAGGSLSDIIANDLGTTNSVVQIDASDFAFKSDNCGGWTKIG